MPNVNNTARNAKPNKADRARSLTVKALAKAAKDCTDKALDALRVKAAENSAADQRSGRLYAHKLNHEGAFIALAFSEHGLAGHWSQLHKSANVKAEAKLEKEHPGSNKRATMALDWIKQERDAFIAELDKRGHTNPDKAWSDIRNYAFEAFTGGKKQKRERDPKTVDADIKATCVPLYKRVIKETMPTDKQSELIHELGLLLIKLGVDLSQFNDKA